MSLKLYWKTYNRFGNGHPLQFKRLSTFSITGTGHARVAPVVQIPKLKQSLNHKTPPLFYQELEVLTDPMRKEVAMVRKKIDVEKEYREVLEAFNEKNNEKTQLTSTLVELAKESEKFRMGKLEELSKVLNPKR
ncbi:hypothetical protein RND71_015018 [Anisodus tanguticus]|uniref:Uncharacterized protein n=1 Tax=Anisodus tanguticus TaxID=243964 RepID=A0AAE1SAN8_9SOLA|nr:hypothetical protein RND71_015018 [Anisodus tanguticus]